MRIGRNGERGQSALETALTLPLVFTLIMGVLELGVAFNAYTTLVSAAREGARAGAVYLYDSAYSQTANDQNRESGIGTVTPYTDNIRDTVASSLGILSNSLPAFDKNSDVTISYAPPPGATRLLQTRKGELVSVRVVYRHSLMTQLLANQSAITMTAQATARIE